MGPGWWCPRGEQRERVQHKEGNGEGPLLPGPTPAISQACGQARGSLSGPRVPLP